MGWIARAQADLARAQVLLEESVTIFRELGNAYELAIAMRHLGIVVRDQGDNERATLLLKESLAISREQGSQWQISGRLMELGALARDQGDYGHATALLEQSLAVCRRLEDTAGIAEVLHHLGETALLQGDDARATALEQESLRLARDPWPLINLGYLAQQEGDHRRATWLLTESLVIARERSTRWYTWAIPECLAAFASVASRQGQLERAAQLFGAAEKLHEAIHNLPVRAHLLEIERTVTIVRTQLDEDAFASAWAEGRALTLEQVIAYALEGSKVDSASSITTAASQ